MAAPEEGDSKVTYVLTGIIPGRGPGLPVPGILTGRIPFLKFD